MLVFIFLLGTAIGSFLNVLIDRLPKGESVISGRSYCDHCHKKLAWSDLIPLLSFLFLNRKCRYCKKPLSWQYPMVELVSGLLFVLAFLMSTQSGLEQVSSIKYQVLSINDIISVLYPLYIVSSFVVIFVTDLKYGIIPNKIVYFSIIISFLYFILNTNYLLLSHLLSGFGAFVFFFIIFLLTKGKGMGFGDVKLSFWLGLLLGFPGIVIGLYLAFLTGGAVSSILVLWRKKKFFGGTVPFGPFLILGAFIAFFWENTILHFLFSVLLR